VQGASPLARHEDEPDLSGGDRSQEEGGAMSEKMDARKRSIFAATMAAIAGMFSIRQGARSASVGLGGGSFTRGNRAMGFYAANRNSRRRWKKLRQIGQIQMRRSRSKRRKAA